jgi:hypothetical protein
MWIVRFKMQNITRTTFYLHFVSSYLDTLMKKIGFSVKFLCDMFDFFFFLRILFVPYHCRRHSMSPSHEYFSNRCCLLYKRFIYEGSSMTNGFCIPFKTLGHIGVCQLHTIYRLFIEYPDFPCAFKWSRRILNPLEIIWLKMYVNIQNWL